MSDNHDMRGSTTGRLAELSDNDARCRPTHLHQSARDKNASLCPEMLLLALPHSKCGQANTDLLCGPLCQLRQHSTVLIVVGNPLVRQQEKLWEMQADIGGQILGMTCGACRRHL